MQQLQQHRGKAWRLLEAAGGQRRGGKGRGAARAAPQRSGSGGHAHRPLPSQLLRRLRPSPGWARWARWARNPGSAPRLGEGGWGAARSAIGRRPADERSDYPRCAAARQGWPTVTHFSPEGWLLGLGAGPTTAHRAARSACFAPPPIRKGTGKRGVRG